MELVNLLLQILVAVLIGCMLCTMLDRLFDSLESEKKLNEVKTEYYQKMLKEGE